MASVLSTFLRNASRGGTALVRHARQSSNLAAIKDVRTRSCGVLMAHVRRLLTRFALWPLEQLRERSGAPMHEVKAALVATNWDVGASCGSLRLVCSDPNAGSADAALKELRSRGHLAASKKARARVSACAARHAHS